MKVKRIQIMYSGILLLLLNFYIRFSDIINVNDEFSKIILFIGLSLIIVSSYLKGKVIIKTLAYILALISYYLSKQSDILQFIIVIVSLQGEDVKSIIKFIYKFTSVVLIVHIFLYFILYLYNSTIIHFNYRLKANIVEIRHTFLFSHSNIFSAILCWWYLSYLYLNEKKRLIKELFVLIFVTLLIILFSKTRTSLIVIYVTIFTMFVYRRTNNKIFKKMIKHSIEILSILFISFIFLYPQSNFIVSLDSMLEARIKLGYVAKDKYGISMLGQDIPYNENDDYFLKFGLSNTGITLDSTVYKLLLSNGILNLLIFIVYIFSQCKKRNDNEFDNCFLLSYALFAAVESFGLYPLLSFPILLLGNNIKEG